MVYLDHNASTPLDERVLEAMLPYLKGIYANPSSVHEPGRQARAALDQAREQVALLVNAHPSQVIFNSGGTEANNTAIKGVAFATTAARMVLGQTEHASVKGPAQSLQRHGWRVAQASCSEQGIVSPQSLAEVLDSETRLASVMWANNETGVIQSINELADVCRANGTVLHTDAVQAAGKVEIDFAASGVQLMSLSAHKMYGPKGVGALIVDKAIALEPLLHGGGQERERRGGTENLAAIVGFGKAAELVREELELWQSQLLMLRDYFEASLRRELPQAVIFGEAAERLGNTSFFAIPSLEGRTLIMALDRLGFAIASGSACGSEKHEPTPVLKAMGVATELAHGAIRVSFGRQNSKADVDKLIAALTSQVKQLQGMGAATAWT